MKKKTQASVIDEIYRRIELADDKIQDASHELSRLRDEVEELQDPAGIESPVIREAIQFGLKSVEAKYGLSSAESSEVREFLSQ